MGVLFISFWSGFLRFLRWFFTLFEAVFRSFRRFGVTGKKGEVIDGAKKQSKDVTGRVTSRVTTKGYQ